MIVNNVLLKLKNPSTDLSKVQASLISMKGNIDVLKDIQVEKNIRLEGGAYDILLITKFSSMEALDAYLIHPVHLEVSKFVGSAVDTLASLCYEIK